MWRTGLVANDLVTFTNNLNANLKNGILISDVSDHLPIFCGTLNCKSVESTCVKKEKYNLKREVNSDNIRNLKIEKMLGCVEWTEVYSL